MIIKQLIQSGKIKKPKNKPPYEYALEEKLIIVICSQT